MLQVTVPASELFDEATQTFVETKETVLHLEHSLISISRWESKWCIPFLTEEPKTLEQSIDYVRCMTMDQHVDPTVYLAITNDVMNKVQAYIEKDQTATKINVAGGKSGRPRRKRPPQTSEQIYSFMVQYRIPFECEKWHLSRLLMLIRCIQVENMAGTKQNRMSRSEALSRMHALNEERKSEMHTHG